MKGGMCSSHYSVPLSGLLCSWWIASRSPSWDLCASSFFFFFFSFYPPLTILFWSGLLMIIQFKSKAVQRFLFLLLNLHDHLFFFPLSLFKRLPIRMRDAPLWDEIRAAYVSDLSRGPLVVRRRRSVFVCVCVCVSASSASKVTEDVVKCVLCTLIGFL